MLKDIYYDENRYLNHEGVDDEVYAEIYSIEIIDNEY